MKILVSAFACNLYQGSEPGVGWAAVCRIARKHEVFVLTDDHNRMGWKRAATEQKIPGNVHVRFLRHAKPSTPNRFLAHLQSWISYSEYNGLVLKAAEEWHREVGFDLCHQVTIAAWRMPSPLWQLPIPFVWGPIGGAGFIPPSFRSMLSPAARCLERARDLNTLISSRSRAFRNCIQNTAVIIAANEETEEFLKPFRGVRPMVRLPVASLSTEKTLEFKRPNASSSLSAPIRLFAGGNIEGRKGVSLALRALAIVAEKGIDFRYTIAGGGPEILSLQALAEKLKIADKVIFHPGFQGVDYIHQLWDSDVYFLPSFRETMGMTLVEAMLAGCYPVVADTSAQGEIVRMAGGSAVPVTTLNQVIRDLAAVVLWCNANRSDFRKLADQTVRNVVQYFASDRYDRIIDECYETAINRLSGVRG